MAILGWLAIPVLTTLIATVWLSRRHRHATPEQQQQGIEEMDRFRQALAKPLPKRGPGA